MRFKTRTSLGSDSPISEGKTYSSVMPQTKRLDNLRRRNKKPSTMEQLISSSTSGTMSRSLFMLNKPTSVGGIGENLMIALPSCSLRRTASSKEMP
jgi:hypothetical protein